MKFKQIIPSLLVSIAAKGCIVEHTGVSEMDNTTIEAPAMDNTGDSAMDNTGNQICEKNDDNLVTFNKIIREIVKAHQINTNTHNLTCLSGDETGAQLDGLTIGKNEDGNFDFAIHLSSEHPVETQVLCTQEGSEPTNALDLRFEEIKLFPIGPGQYESYPDGTETYTYPHLSSNMGVAEVNNNCQITHRQEATPCHSGTVTISRQPMSANGDNNITYFWCTKVNF